MPIRIDSLPVTKTFKLACDDTPDPAIVTIRQATTGDNLKRADLTAEASFIVNTVLGEQEVKQRINVYEQRRFDVFLTLADCTLIGDGDETYFKFKNGKVSSQAEFNRLWDALPIEVSDEIYGHVIKVNPQWGNASEGE